MTTDRERQQAAANDLATRIHQGPALRQIFLACRDIGGPTAKVEMNVAPRGLSFAVSWVQGGERYTCGRLVTDYDLPPEPERMGDTICELLREAMTTALQQRALPDVASTSPPPENDHG